MLLSGIALAGWAAGSSAAKADEQSDRELVRAVAFNHGHYDRKALDTSKEHGIADETKRTNDHATVRHLFLQVLENNRESTNKRTTLMALCTTDFHSAIGNMGQSFPVVKVRVESVMLDSSGKSKEANTMVMEHESVIDNKTGKLSWTKKTTPGQSVRKFHDEALPDWAKKKFWQVSGFLDQNTGGLVIDYVRPDSEIALEALDLALSVAPGLFKNFVGKLAEEAAKKAALKGLKAAVEDESLRFGQGTDITNKELIKSKEKFQEIGRKMWSKKDKQ
jgi:hypothetical protein